MKRLKYSTRAKPHGPCNICGAVGQLTDDHIPPKGCPGVSTVRMHQLFRVLVDGSVPHLGRQAQGGVKYRTLCGDCNSKRLGVEYDPDLILLAQDVDRILSALNVGITLPSHTLVRIRPQRVLRSVIGHILAAGVERLADGDWDLELVEYFMNSHLLFPACARIHYWIYPFQQQVVIRDACFLSLLESDKGKNPTLFMCIKFYPLAFLIVDYRDNNYRFNLPCLSEYGSMLLDAEVQLPLYLKNFPRETWPEAPSMDHIVVYGGNPLFARRSQ